MREYCQSCGLDKAWVEECIRDLSYRIHDLQRRLNRLEIMGNVTFDVVFAHFKQQEQEISSRDK